MAIIIIINNNNNKYGKLQVNTKIVLPYTVQFYFGVSMNTILYPVSMMGSLGTYAYHWKVFVRGALSTGTGYPVPVCMPRCRYRYPGTRVRHYLGVTQTLLQPWLPAPGGPDQLWEARRWEGP